MIVNSTKIGGCYEIFPTLHSDNRGSFVKTFQASVFQSHNLRTDFVEEFYSVSGEGVLRGLHFQTPPKDHAKLVYCLAGKAFDVAVDLRLGSPTYGQHHVFELSDEASNVVYMPSGIAHGFLSMSCETILIYKTTAEYSPIHDSGIRWDSLDIPWPKENPIVSERDSLFPPFDSFNSSFLYKNWQTK